VFLADRSATTAPRVAFASPVVTSNLLADSSKCEALARKLGTTGEEGRNLHRDAGRISCLSRARVFTV
jgi:hypothetical protein